jgi:microsomal dipeptidase-like Zn-dependent dipeptidase
MTGQARHSRFPFRLPGDRERHEATEKSSGMTTAALDEPQRSNTRELDGIPARARRCTHSSMRALSDVPRNVTDDMLRALAKNGGVIGITFGEGFINPKDAEALRAAIEIETNAPLLTGRALDDHAAEAVRKLFGTRVKVASTVEDVADHIDQAVKIAGIDHVGIGSDYEGESTPSRRESSHRC